MAPNSKSKKEIVSDTLRIHDSESEDDFADSDEESVVPQTSKKDIRRPLDEDEEEADDFEDDDSEDELVTRITKKPDYKKQEDQESEGEDEEDDEEEGNIRDSQVDADEMVTKERKRNRKLKKLTPEQLEKEQKRIKKTGVCYLSKVPPYMKPSKLRSVLSRFGKIDRLFLKPEDSAIYHKRKKYGGNKKKNFTEGWIEFVNKKDAKLCAETLNANILGGKKTSYYYDDVINMKYLSGFKWFDLTQQIAKENEVRQAKLSLELSQQQKLNKNFITNVEKSKMIAGIQKKRKAKEESEGTSGQKAADMEIRRTFKQRKISSKRADANEKIKAKSKPNENLDGVLSQVF